MLRKDEGGHGPDGQFIDILALVRLFRRGRWRILICVAVAVVFAVIYIITTPPFFSSRALVVVDPERSEFIDMRGAFGTDVAGLENDDISIGDEVRILRSRRVLQRTVDILKLTEHPEFNTQLRDVEGFRPGVVVAAIVGGIRDLFASDTIENGGSTSLEDKLLRGVTDKLYNAIRIERSLNSRVIGIEATLEDPEMAAAIANTIAESYIEFQREDRLASSQRTVEWMTIRIADLEEQVRLSSEEANSFRLQIGTVDDEKIGDLTDRLQRLKSALDNTRAARVEAATQTGEAASAAVLRLRQQERALERSIQISNQELLDLANSQQELLQLERQAQADRLIYERFLDELKEIDALGSLGYSSARIIEQAETPLAPAGPDKKTALAVALLLGGVIGLAVVIITEFMRRGYNSRDELENGTGLPVLASLPKLSDKIDMRELLEELKEKPHSEFSEAMRGLRAAIVSRLPKQSSRVVAITSTAPGDGKTSLAAALAFVASTSQKKVILVDADLRRSNLAVTLELEAEDYLDDLLFEKISLDSAIQKSKEYGIEILPVRPNGMSDPNAVDEDAFREILDKLRKRYELVIVDTPPITPVFDAGVFSSHCDLTLLVVNFAETKRTAVKEALRRFSGLGITSAGLVYNRVDFKAEAAHRGVVYESYQDYWRGA